jgi:hypothetical protein
MYVCLGLKFVFNKLLKIINFATKYCIVFKEITYELPLPKL